MAPTLRSCKRTPMPTAGGSVWLERLPWNQRSAAPIAVARVRAALDAGNAGLDTATACLLQHAVRRRNPASPAVPCPRRSASVSVPASQGASLSSCVACRVRDPRARPRRGRPPRRRHRPAAGPLSRSTSLLRAPRPATTISTPDRPVRRLLRRDRQQPRSSAAHVAAAPDGPRPARTPSRKTRSSPYATLCRRNSRATGCRPPGPDVLRSRMDARHPSRGCTADWSLRDRSAGTGAAIPPSMSSVRAAPVAPFTQSLSPPGRRPDAPPNLLPTCPASVSLRLS